MPAPTPPIRFGACLEAAQVGSDPAGALRAAALPLPHLCRSAPTSRRSCPIAASRAPACASRWRPCSTPWRAQLGTRAGEVRLAEPGAARGDAVRQHHGKQFDSGDYPDALRRAVAAIDLAGAIAPARGEPDDGGSASASRCSASRARTAPRSITAWGIPMVPGHEQAMRASRPTACWSCGSARTVHGQGMETTLAQVAHEILGVHPDARSLVHGDTALTPYSTGTWGSRCDGHGGRRRRRGLPQLGERVRRDRRRAAAGPAADVGCAEGGWSRAGGASPSPRWRAPGIARRRTCRRRRPGGLEVTAGYRPKRDTGTFSYAGHAAVVAVDPETGAVELLDYVVVEDGGKLVNPMIVDGQVIGGLAQGIGTALYEEMPFDARGPAAGLDLADYLLPGPDRGAGRAHRAYGDASPYHIRPEGNRRGRRDRPSGGIVNAVNDALAALGAEMLELPISRAARGGGDPRPRKAPRHEAGRLRLCAPRAVAGGRAMLGARLPGRCAGGQSLGPMLNLRLAQPDTDRHLRASAGLAGVAAAGDVLRIGAGTTHAAIEDGAVPGPTGGILAGVARGIAYRAVRNRGTIGGSLAHADPGGGLGRGADRVGRHGDRVGAAGKRRIALAGFVTGVFETALAAGRAAACRAIPVLPARALGSLRSAARPASSPRPRPRR